MGVASLILLHFGAWDVAIATAQIEGAARIPFMLKMILGSHSEGDWTMFPLSRNFLKFAAASALRSPYRC